MKAIRFKKTDGLIRLRYWAEQLKYRPTRTQLRAKLLEIIRDWVQVILEDSPGSAGPSPQRYARLCADFWAELRIQSVKARIWTQVHEMLAEERFEQLRNQALKRGKTVAIDSAQLTFEGFPHLPRKIQSGRAWLPLQTATVNDLLSFTGRYVQRKQKNDARGADLLRLAALIADQPPELSVPEAVARATSGKAEEAAARK